MNREEIAYSEAVRALDEQRSTIDTLQSRAGVLLAVVAAVNVGLGGAVLDQRTYDAYEAAVAGGAVAAAIAIILLLWTALPMTIRFSAPSVAVLERTAPFDVADDELQALMVRTMDTVKKDNAKVIDRRFCALRSAIWSTTIGAVLWAGVLIAEGR